MDGSVVGDIVSIVAERRREKREQPDGIDPQVLQIIELLQQSGKIADAVVVAVAEGANVQLINNRVFVPERSGLDCQFFDLLSPNFRIRNGHPGR